MRSECLAMKPCTSARLRPAKCAPAMPRWSRSWSRHASTRRSPTGLMVVATYSGIGTNNAPNGIQDRSCSLRPQCPAVTAPAGTGQQNCIRRGCGEAARAFRAARARVQGLARLAAEGLPSEHGLDSVPFVLLGDHRQAHNLSILLCQHMAREVVPRVKPEGRLSCSLCMISTIVPESLSLSRL